VGAADPIRPIGGRSADPFVPVTRVQRVRRRGRADAEDERPAPDQDACEDEQRDPEDDGGGHIDLRA
jgi:hypothetical protein